MRTVPLNLVMTYPVYWSRYQVLRDYVQNFYDSVGYKEWNKRFCYTYSDSVLTMWIDEVSFNYEWLMHIGASTKTKESGAFAGFFGEGFKIASLCALRDMGWEVKMMSDDWLIDVTDIEQHIDGTPVRMLAYNITSREIINETKLILKNVNFDDYNLFKAVLDSFFYEENLIMGEKVWQGEEGAVFLRSKNPINQELPSTREFGRKGAVFCGYQMRGTNPFDLVVCLHHYKQVDRERKSLYAFNVIDVFEGICRYIDAECAMVMLEKMRRYWNTYPKKKIDIYSWSGPINILVRKVANCDKTRNEFYQKHNNLLYVKRIRTISEKNRRWQAKSWLKNQYKKYILVKDTFRLLGYRSLEEECDINDGFVEDDNANSIQEKGFSIFEDICNSIFQGFFIYQRKPKRKIITNYTACYHGMAVTYKKRHFEMNNMGLKVVSEIDKIYLKKEIFNMDGYYDGLSTYIHEMCHMFGGDATISFSRSLTYATEILLKNHSVIADGKRKWEDVFAEEMNSYNGL